MAAGLGGQKSLADLYQTPFLNWLVFSSVAPVIMAFCVIFSNFTAELIQCPSQLRNKDQLTGLLSRKGLKAKYAMFGRHNQVATKTILICNIDQFSLINHAYGRQTADATLVQFAKMFASLATPFDLPARISTNSFALIKTRTPVAKAQQISEFFRQKVEQANFADCGMDQIITCTILVMKLPLYEEIEDVLIRAENAMKQIKQIKRNRVVVLHDNELIH